MNKEKRQPSNVWLALIKNKDVNKTKIKPKQALLHFLLLFLRLLSFNLVHNFFAVIMYAIKTAPPVTKPAKISSLSLIQRKDNKLHR